MGQKISWKVFLSATLLLILDVMMSVLYVY